MCYTNHIHKILLFLTPAYVYCIFSILVPQISLQSYVTRKPYLTPLELLPCRVYTLSKSNFLIFSTQCYIITNPVELKQSFQPFHKTQLQFWCSPISTIANMCVLFFFYFKCRTAGYRSVFGRSCDRPSRHRFFLVSLCPKANAEMVPKIPSCHYMLLM